MVNLGPLRPPRLVSEALGIGAIPVELSAILADRFQTVCEDRVALPSDKLSGRGVYSFLVQIVLGVDHIPGLDWVTLVGVDPDRTVHLLK